MNLSNFSQIRHNGKDIALAKLNGDIVYRKGDTPVEPIEKEYAIEYTITARNSSDTLTAKYTYNSTNYYYYLPRMYNSDMTSWSITGYDKIEITKTDGTITDDTSTLASKVEKIKVWYPKTTPRIYFYGYSTAYPCYITKVLNSTKMNTTNLTSMNSMFCYCTSLTSLDLSNWNTSKVTSMNNMFYYCQSLTSLDLSNWNTSKVTSMNNMFYYCQSLTSLDLSSFDTSSVTSMNNMFYYCQSLTSLDLSSFDTSSVTSMKDMFQFGRYSTIKELIIPKWNMTKISIDTIYCDLFGNSSTSTHDRNLTYIDLSESNNNTINKLIRSLSSTKTQTSYGKMLVPETTSESVISSMVAKYWKPIGPIIEPISFEIVSELDEIIGLGESTKLYYGNYEPWYSDGEIEFILPDNSVAYINENNELISTEYGSVEIYAMLKSNNDIISNTITVDISDADSHPYVIKFISGIVSPSTSDTIKVNGTNIKLSNIPHSRVNNMYTYDVGAPITSIQFNGNRNSSCKNIEKIIKLDTSNITDMSYMFYNCQLSSTLDLSSFDTSNVTSMSSMFYYCTSLTSLDLSNWDTSNVTTMDSMFYYCTSLTTLDLSNWDTSNVNDMHAMFQYCYSLTSLDLSNWDTSNVKYMSSMLFNTPVDINFHYNGNNYQNFNLTEVSCNYESIFPWNKPTDLTYSDSYYVEYTVADCSAPLNYGTQRKIGLPTASFNGLQTYEVLRIEITLNDNSTTDNISTPCNMIKKVKVYYPESCDGIIFSSQRSYTIDNISYYNVFEYIGYINTTNFTNMKYMFNNCQSLTSLDLSRFNTSNVTDMSSMFSNCTSLTSLDLSNWNTSNVTDMREMFNGCSSLISVIVSGWDTSNVTDISFMFNNCTGLTLLDLSSWDTSSLNDISVMFQHCYSLTSLDLSNWNTSNVTSMSSMFYCCSSLVSLDVSSFNTSNVTDMSSMFEGCSSLTSLDLSNWDFSNVNNISGMFSGMGSGSELYITFPSNMYFNNLCYANNTFYSCNLSYDMVDNLRYWDGMRNLQYANGMFQNVNTNTTLDLSSWNVYYLNEAENMFRYCGAGGGIYITNWSSEYLYSYSGMFDGVYCSVYVSSSDWYLSESEVGYNGTFNWW